MRSVLRVLGFLLGIAFVLMGVVFLADSLQGKGRWWVALSWAFTGAYFCFYGLTGYSDLLGKNGFLRRQDRKP